MSSKYRDKIEKSIETILTIEPITDELGRKVVDKRRIEAEKMALIANCALEIADAIRESGDVVNNVEVKPATPIAQTYIYPKDSLTTQAISRIRRWLRYHRFTKATR